MKNCPFHSIVFAAASLVASAIMTTAFADVSAVTQTGTDTYVLDTVTINGTVYSQSDISLGQLDAVMPASGAALGEIKGFVPGAGGANLVNINAASSSFIFGTSALNIATGSIFQFGRAMTDTDSIFLLEYDPSENVVQTFQLVDASNEVIGSYSFSFNIRDDITDNLVTWPDGVTFRTTTGAGGIAASVDSLGGLSMTLSDFGVTAGDVTNATGIRFQNGVGLDAPIMGLVSVPETKSYALILGLVGLAFVNIYRRRRR